MSLLKIKPNNALVLSTPKRGQLLREGVCCPLRHQYIGRGTFGIVFKAIYKDRPVAAKIIRNHTEAGHVNFHSTLHNEAHALHLKHTNIVNLIALETTSQFSLIIMEGPVGQCLQRWLDTHLLQLEQRTCIAIDIAAALLYCHSHDLLHLDVKPSNIVIVPSYSGALCIHNNRYISKLCDFGSSIRLGICCSLQSTSKGTICYMAPEALQAASLSTASDVYSLAITMWQMQSHRIPYHIFSCNESIAYQVVKYDIRPDHYKGVTEPKRFHCTECDFAYNLSNNTGEALSSGHKKNIVRACRKLNFNRKFGHDHIMRDIPLSKLSTRCENSYTVVYKICWLKEPDLRLNLSQLKMRLEQIMAKLSKGK